MRAAVGLGFGSAALFWLPSVEAHALGRPATLPVPVWMFLAAGAAAVLVSFLAVVLVAARSSEMRPARTRRWLGARVETFARVTRVGLGVVGITLLGLVLTASIAGHPEPEENIAVPLVWIGLVVGFTYVVAGVGNLWSWLNPWRAAVEGMEWLRGRPFAGAWPRTSPTAPVAVALAFYVAFVWIELVTGTGSEPRSLGGVVALYTAVNLVGVVAWGSRSWFAHGEFLSVFYRLVGQAGIFRRVAGGVELRAPFGGLRTAAPAHVGTVLFVLFMLASTAYDGFRSSRPGDVVRAALATALGGLGDGRVPDALVMAGVAAAFVALYFGTMALLARGTRGAGVPELASRFAPSLVPIALGYHVAHYLNLLFVQGQLLIALASDPLGRGWDLFGTAARPVDPGLVSTTTLWYIQVLALVAGHVLGVWISHLEFAQAFPSRARAVAAHLPLLALMVAYTVGGLWLLTAG